MQRGPGQSRASPSPAERSLGSQTRPAPGEREASWVWPCWDTSRAANSGADVRQHPTLMMLACSTLHRMAISKVTFPSLGSSIQQSSKTFSFLINFTTTYKGDRECHCSPSHWPPNSCGVFTSTLTPTSTPMSPGTRKKKPNNHHPM